MADSFKPGIQGLRGLAVVLVLVFHIWPALISGGYVGVDVFFVISGFLITGILYGEVASEGSLHLFSFYAKRIRRLIPAATAVLAGVAVSAIFVPRVRYTETAHQIVASALYFQNWLLANQAVDYMASENAAGPLQHFWSLSMEEQYYLVWPLIIMCSAYTARKLERPVFGVALWVVGTALISSLSYSIYLTPRDPEWAYFSTFTRVWELSLGSALAIITTRKRWELSGYWGDAVAVSGGAAMLIAAAAITGDTLFPGYAALMPAMGATAVLWVVSDSPGAITSLLFSNRIMVYLGDISYSFYLWHWPVVVFAKNILRVDRFGWRDGLVVLVISLALAHTSKQLIEDRWRKYPVSGSGVWRTYGLGVAGILISLTCAVLICRESGNAMRNVTQKSQASIEANDVEFYPSIEDAENDLGQVYSMGCITTARGTEVKQCNLVSNPGAFRVVVVGDSHAVSWLPALEMVANEENWDLIAVVKSACTFADFTPEYQEKAKLDTMRSCLTWSSAAIEHVKGLRPDLIVITHARSSMFRIAGPDSVRTIIAEAMYRALTEAGHENTRFVAIADTPTFRQKIPECMSLKTGDYRGCGIERKRAFHWQDPIVKLTELYPQVELIDMTDRICDSTMCNPVVRGILAWRDAHHMTNTFSKSLAGDLGDRIKHAISK